MQGIKDSILIGEIVAFYKYQKFSYERLQTKLPTASPYFYLPHIDNMNKSRNIFPSTFAQTNRCYPSRRYSLSFQQMQKRKLFSFLEIFSWDGRDGTVLLNIANIKPWRKWLSLIEIVGYASAIRLDLLDITNIKPWRDWLSLLKIVACGRSGVGCLQLEVALHEPWKERLPFFDVIRGGRLADGTFFQQFGICGCFWWSV